ncbi:hypothetical protein Lwal_2500 [Legionella waltersii]|uniref:Uncharacterized protein n=1 Tax=Legionella waltersii TaxID=66969 RepID=A0A0W1A2J8_9GAMM|nr:hypothetical protein Lwal_2500 [Legionella waltersii]SNU98732.1 Uncharacterised protein [Legionella waltersii]
MRAARFLRCCLNQILVTAGSEPSRARQQADTELSVFTNDAAKAAPFGEAPNLGLLTIKEEMSRGTIIGVDSSWTDPSRFRTDLAVLKAYPNKKSLLFYHKRLKLVHLGLILS